MDEIKVFHTNNEIIEGLYYIETDNYFPHAITVVMAGIIIH